MPGPAEVVFDDMGIMDRIFELRVRIKARGKMERMAGAHAQICGGG